VLAIQQSDLSIAHGLAIPPRRAGSRPEAPRDRAPEPVARPAGDLAEGIHEARLCALIYENRRERPRRSAIV
jgi:hypothetical protein